MKLFKSLVVGTFYSSVQAEPVYGQPRSQTEEKFPRVPTNSCHLNGVQGKSCQDILRADSEAKSGLYRIQMPGLKPTVVECVMEHGTGYTVVQKRTTGHLSFNQNWEAYKAGFSSFTEPDGLTHETFQRGPRPELCKLEEYWIGLDYIHELSAESQQNSMRIDLQRYTREVGTVTYDNFVVSDESDNYRLKSIGEFHNDPGPNLGNAFVGSGFGLQGYSPKDQYNTNHVGMEFSTYDRDHDKYFANCADQDSSGWWFNRCSAVNLNGLHYGEDSSALFTQNAHGFDDGILWQSWTNNKYESLIASKMMLGASQTENDKSYPDKKTERDCQGHAKIMFNDGQLSKSTQEGSLDGIYTIIPDVDKVEVQCKFQICGGQPVGWTLIQRRYDGRLEFDRTWAEYKRGFGFITNSGRGPRPVALGEGWIGNDIINALTEEIDPKGVSLLIELERKAQKTPNKALIGYDRFAIGDERQSYKLNVIGEFSNIKGDAGNAFWGDGFNEQGFGHDLEDTDHRGMKFSTKDRDNDNTDYYHCGKEDKSGWWFNACSAGNLNGHYYSSGLVDQQYKRQPSKRDNMNAEEFDDGILWNTWTHDKWESLVDTKMWLSHPNSVQTCYPKHTGHFDSRFSSSDSSSIYSKSSIEKEELDYADSSFYDARGDNLSG